MMTTIISSSHPTNHPNPAFDRSLAFLAHPLNLAALGLLLLNDYFLRRLWPSWITGKLSDAAWLFIVPFMLAAMLSWALPRRGAIRRVHTRLTFALAYTLTGLVYVLVKTSPPVNGLVGNAFLTLTGLRPALSLDGMDLLALPALFTSLGWSLLDHKKEHLLAVPRWRLALLPLAALVLLGDAAAPDFGITCFTVDQGTVYAKTGYSSMASNDGGLTWSYDSRSVDCSSQPNPAIDQWHEVRGPKPGTVYRFRPGESIQVSADGAKNWQVAYRIVPVSEAERYYLTKSHLGSPIYSPGPLDAVADPASGNMLFAMGQQGVLVQTPDGEWVGKAAGAYRPVGAFPNADAFALLMGGMLILAAGLALLIFASLALRWTRHWLRYVILAIAWIGWAALDVLFPPAISENYALTVSGFGMMAVAVFLLPLVIEQVIRMVKRAPRAILPLAGFGLAAGLLYLVPYLLWLYNLLPGFALTTIIALVPGIIGLAWGVFWGGSRNRTAQA